MNLYLRLLWVLISGLRGERQSLLDEVKVDFRVFPHDCDLNFHLTNARYSSFMDLSRMYATGRYRLILRLLRRGWLPVIDAQEISYLRALAPGEKFQIATQLVGWTESHFFFKHRMYSDRGAAAVGYARGLFMHKGKIIPMKEIIGLVSRNTDSPELPEEILAFHARAAEKRTRYRRRLRNGPISSRRPTRVKNGSRRNGSVEAHAPQTVRSPESDPPENATNGASEPPPANGAVRSNGSSTSSHHN